MAIDEKFWANQRVFITGHTGFKGAWSSFLLNRFGATLSGYSLPEAATNPNLYDISNLHHCFENDTRGNLTDLETLKASMGQASPTIMFHMAAQSLVLNSYQDPVTTYMSNVIGTANVLEAARSISSLKAIVVVTTDKCYKNFEGEAGYVEDSPLGGHDPYSSSKACAELVSDSFRSSFFNADGCAQIATARAGNVIGGGDWADNRLIPDCYRAFSSGASLELRNADAVRPWQHVIEPLVGYMVLAQQLTIGTPGAASAWNFGPTKHDELSTQQVVDIAKRAWGKGEVIARPNPDAPLETKVLRLNSSKANSKLDWAPKWSGEQAIEKAMSWYLSVHSGVDPSAETEKQINEYFRN